MSCCCDCYDYYAHLHSDSGENEPPGNDYPLASGFVDECTAGQDPQDQKETRRLYMHRAAQATLSLPPALRFEPDHCYLPNSTWFGIEVSFTLRWPWHSKDDRPFHVLDNPVRKDRVFGVPFMSAASWKGLLRWACRMQAGLFVHLAARDMKMTDWKDPPWIIHLFGNAREEGEQFQAGALICYPTWFEKVGFEVINPHSRARRAGTHPIYYEVVPAGTQGSLKLLYAPLPGNDRIAPTDFDELIDSIEALLETYGISSKRTAGWGTAQIEKWMGFVTCRGQSPSRACASAKDFKQWMRDHIAHQGR